LVQVHVEGTPTSYTTIIRDLQRDPIKRNLRHLDLQVLNLAEKIRLPIQIILNGESPAVKNFGGLLLHLLDEVEVECLPTALVPAIEVNISGLKELGQAIFVRDLVLPPGLTVLTDADEMVAQVTAAEAEEVLAEATTEAAAEVEVIRKKKEEEVEEEKKK
jgi:large subunit ribosomal protein L25